MRSFIPWIGGKGSLIHEILPRFPKKYNRYVEVFGGGASILFAKKRKDSFEIYNDIQSNLVNLFNVVRMKPLSFIYGLGFTPFNSREDFNHFKNLVSGNIDLYRYLENELEVGKQILEPLQFDEIKTLLTTKAKAEDVNRAVNYYYLIRYSYSSRGTSFACRPMLMADVPHTIMKASQRLKSAVIENKGFEDLILHYDRDDTFFYCDPPYFESEDVYNELFTLDQHQQLHDLLSNIKGKFLLSYNNCEFIKDLYKGFHIVEVQRLHNMKQRYEAGSQYKELLIANYDISTITADTTHQLSLWNSNL